MLLKGWVHIFIMSDVDANPEQINEETSQELDKIKAMLPHNKPMTEVGEGCSIMCDPLVQGNRLYFGACNNYIYCLNTGTGEVMWKFRTGGQITMSNPFIWKNTLFQTCYDQYIYALDARTGELKWKFRTGGPMAGSPNVYKEKVYFLSQGDDSHFYCLNAKTGELVWKFYCRYGGVSCPIFLNGNVLFTSTDQYLYCLNADNGEIVWKFFMDLKAITTPCIVNEKGGMIAGMKMPGPVTCKKGSILVGSETGKFYSLNFDGEKQWEYQTGDRIQNCGATVYNKKIYFTSFDNNIYCLNLDGNLIWRYTTGRSAMTTPEVADGVVYCGSADQNMYALDAETGQYLWSFHTGGLLFSSATYQNGKLYFGSWDGYIYCIDTEKKLLDWSFSTGSLAQSTLFGINFNKEEDRIAFAIKTGVDRDLAYKVESDGEHERVGFNPYTDEDEKNPYVSARMDKDNPYARARVKRE